MEISKKQINQCDGCQRGVPLNKWGDHQGKGYDLQGCTASRYIEEKEKHVHRLDLLGECYECGEKARCRCGAEMADGKCTAEIIDLDKSSSEQDNEESWITELKDLEHRGVVDYWSVYALFKKHLSLSEERGYKRGEKSVIDFRKKETDMYEKNYPTEARELLLRGSQSALEKILNKIKEYRCHPDEKHCSCMDALEDSLL